MVVKQWQVAECDKDLVAQIAQNHNIDPLAAWIAVSRGLVSDEQIDEFFYYDDIELSDPFSYKDMDLAVERINRAIDNFERIAVFGDYDADGVTATALLCSYLEIREANFIYDLPKREEGYGLSNDVVDRLHEMGAELIITVDNGINSVSETEYAKELGIDLVITDHHRAGDIIPDACAVVNPHRPDCPSTFKDLAGVGVAFKLVCALEGGESEEMLDEFSDLVTIGTIADIIPIVGENRKIISRGIARISDEPRPGIYAMRKSAGHLDKPFNSSAVAFTIAPRLNAAGRMGSSMQALKILLCEDDESAEELSAEIENSNQKRQVVENDIVELAIEQLNENPDMTLDKIIVCDGEGWHHGVIGIVASRIVEKYGRPCLIISKDGDIAKGSGRSLPGFSLFDALSAVSDTLIKFGGHTLAAGITLESAKVDDFRKAINEYAKNIEMPFPVQRIDMRLNPKIISTEILSSLSNLQPFGTSNPTPVFGLFKMKIDSITPLSNGKHIRLSLSKNDTHINAVKFGISPNDFPFPAGSIVDLAVTLDANYYMGETRVSILIKAIRFSAFDHDEYLKGIRSYYDLRRGQKPPEAFSGLVPDRDFAGKMYKALRSRGGNVSCHELLCIDTGNLKRGVCPVLLSLDALSELGLIKFAENGSIHIIENAPKANLDDSLILQKAKSCLENNNF